MRGKTILFICFSLLYGFCIAQQPTLMLPIGHAGPVLSAEFSPDGTKVITVSEDGTAKLWESNTGKLLKDFSAGGDASIAFINSAKFTGDGNKIVINYEDSYVLIWDVESGTENWGWIYSMSDISITDDLNHFSPDGKRIILFDLENEATVFNVDNKQPVFHLIGHNSKVRSAAFSPTGKNIVTASGKGAIKIWDAATGKLLIDAREHTDDIRSVRFSPDGKTILVLAKENTAYTLNAVTGKRMAVLAGYTAEEYATYNRFGPDGKNIIQLSGYQLEDDDNNKKYYDSVSIWDVQTGKLIFTKGNLLLHENSAMFSSDGKKIIAITKQNKVILYNALNGKSLFEISGFNDRVNVVQLSSDGKKIVTASADGTLKTWDLETGKFVSELRGHSAGINDLHFSPDGRKLVTACVDQEAKIWDVESGKLLVELKGRSNILVKSKFSADGEDIIIATEQNMHRWNIKNGKLTNDTTITSESFKRDYSKMGEYSPDSSIMLIWGGNIVNYWGNGAGADVSGAFKLDEIISYLAFSPDSKQLLITTKTNTIKLYDIKKQKFIFTFIAVDSIDYLIADENNYYDGSEAARRLLYFTCGSEIVELDQVKDQLWIPNLADRKMKGETINARTLEELNICGLTPLVKELSDTVKEFHFTIVPRRGGLGETILSINGTPTRTYKPEQLKKTGTNYDLLIPKEDLNTYFISGAENLVTVKAYTIDNTISSRGAVITVNSKAQIINPPNLYAVMVGVSDYKGDELDLKFAAKDATDISNAVSAAAKKLLNTDGKNHVFMYNLTTAKDHYLLPEKNSIKKVLEEIGKKATANDILLIFFAGHGIMAGEADTKQFYFLTADASTLASSFAVKDVGISTTELSEWMKPALMKAQKRILIFDACNSGQAINDIAGADLAVRDDGKAQQIKAIDKLNEKSGLFILSASATNQSAYEMGRYAQGLLTYSLLKAIKQQPDILEDGKYLNISRWFNAAEKTVSELTREYGNKRQEPQIVTNTNFNIGVVDGEVMEQIILPSEKPLFSASNFQNNDENIAIDNLEINRLTDNKLAEISSSVSGAITFISNTRQPGAYALAGRYEVAGKTITAKVIIRQGIEIKFRFQLTGSTDKLDELAASIALEAAGKVK